MAKKHYERGSKRLLRQVATIYELEIFLAETAPRIWRRFEVRSAIALDELHDIIQIVMGWHNCHMHQFLDLKERRYARRHDELDADWHAEDTENRVGHGRARGIGTPPPTSLRLLHSRRQ